MNPFSVLLFIWFVTIVQLSRCSALFAELGERKCTYLRTERMLKARCRDMNLREVPKFLTGGIEVLDISMNRIRKLKKTSFERYTSLRYLLLYDNKIQIIEPDSFSYLTSLEEIDLSNNALTTIPLEIFQLPRLRNLYVDSNELIFLEQDLKLLSKPIKAPLGYLNIADCGLNSIPDMGILPNLWHLNASVNPLVNISVQSFTPMCHLTSVDLKSTSMPTCACQAINKYLLLRPIESNSAKIVDCDIKEFDICPENLNITVDTRAFDECNYVLATGIVINTWIIIAAASGSFVLLFLCIICCTCRRGSKKRKEELHRKKLAKLNDAKANGGETLLKN